VIARSHRKALSATLVCLLALACRGPVGTTWRPTLPDAQCGDPSNITESVFLIGDAGAPKLPKEGTDPHADRVLGAMRDEVDAAVARLGADNVLVLFLGDNVYQTGLDPKPGKYRTHGERVLQAQIASAGEARAIFTAGNHDWGLRGVDGFDRVLAQREFLSQQGPRVRMLPPGGCGGPSVVDLGPHVRIVFLDVIGYSHAEFFTEAHARACPDEPDPLQPYLRLTDLMDENEGRHVVLATHHPLITAGPHGGHYTWKQHLFPLTDFWPWAWLPLPIIGSAYPLSRQLGVTDTDVVNADYTAYVNAVYRASSPRAPMLVAAGHEHSLQVHRDALGMYYAVSGAGSTKKVDRVEPMDSVLMAEAKPGYMRLDVHRKGSLDLEAIAVEGDGPRSIFQGCIAHGPPTSRTIEAPSWGWGEP
jgi:hypothetical protein